MSDVHYFQRYSQKENVVTNSTLLLLSRLHSYSHSRFKDFLNEVLHDAAIEVGVAFKQQTRTKRGGTPDGLLCQASFKIVLETKLHSDFNLTQLKRHLDAFNREETQILLLLSPTEPSADFKLKLGAHIREFNSEKNTMVSFVCTTFEQLIESYESILLDQDYEMRELLEDYRLYCEGKHLLPETDHTMRAVACGWTEAENLGLDIYYDPVDRSCRKHKYIGVCVQKCIVGIGEIENVIDADLIDGTLQVRKQLNPISQDQQDRIVSVIALAKKNNGWDISMNHKFYLVKKFHETEYRKMTKGGLRGMQYFDLRRVLKEESLPDTKRIAEILKSCEW